MDLELTRRRRTHLHALVAGALFTVAAFVAAGIPSALASLLAGRWTSAAVATVAVFLAALGGAVLGTRAWRRRPVGQTF